MKIDFKTEKSEAEWQQAVDRFWLAVAPKWFGWLGWVLILAAITFAAEKTDNLAIRVIKGFSYVSFFMYFQSLFYQFEFENLPRIRNPKLARFISLAVSALLGYGVWLMLHSAVEKLKTAGA